MGGCSRRCGRMLLASGRRGGFQSLAQIKNREGDILFIRGICGEEARRLPAEIRQQRRLTTRIQPVDPHRLIIQIRRIDRAIEISLQIHRGILKNTWIENARHFARNIVHRRRRSRKRQREDRLHKLTLSIRRIGSIHISE